MKLGVAAGLSTATRMGLIESPFPPPLTYEIILMRVGF